MRPTAVCVADVVTVQGAVVVPVIAVLVPVPVGVQFVAAESLQSLETVQRQIAAGRRVPLRRLVHGPDARRVDDRRTGRLQLYQVAAQHRVQRQVYVERLHRQTDTGQV